MPLSEESDPFARRHFAGSSGGETVPPWNGASGTRAGGSGAATSAAAVVIFFAVFKSFMFFAPLLFQVCPGGLPGLWGGAALFERCDPARASA